MTTNSKNSNGSPINISGPNVSEDIYRRLGVGHVLFIEYHLPRDLVAYAPILAAPCHPREENAHPVSTSRRRADLPVLAPELLVFESRLILSLWPHNQVEHRAHDCVFARGEDQATTKCYRVVPSASAYLPDVPRQCTENIDVALTVRECVQVLESGEHAN
jgi:hypothetical protein